MFKALGLIEAQGLVEKENTSLYIYHHISGEMTRQNWGPRSPKLRYQQ